MDKLCSRCRLGRRMAYLLALSLLVTASVSAAAQSLVVLSSLKIDETVVEKFSQRNQVTIEWLTYESDIERDRLLFETPEHAVDIVILDAADVQAYLAADMLEPISADRFDVVKVPAAEWWQVYPALHGWAIPISWRMLGVLQYKTTAEPIDSWKALWALTEEHPDAVAWMSDAQVVAGTLLKSLGYSASDSDLDRFQLLSKGVPTIKRWSGLVSGPGLAVPKRLKDLPAYAVVYHCGWATNDRILGQYDFSIPVEGGLIRVETIAVLRNSQQKGLAFDLVAEMLTHEYTHPQDGSSSCPNTRHWVQLDGSGLFQGKKFPDKHMLVKTDFLQTRSLAVKRVQNQVYIKMRVRSGT